MSGASRSRSLLTPGVVEVGDQAAVARLECYLLYDGALGLLVATASIAFAWPGTGRISPWADVLAVPLVALLAAGVGLLRGGRLGRMVGGRRATRRLGDAAARRVIGRRLATWALAAVALSAAGPRAVTLNFVLGLTGLAFALHGLWLHPRRAGSRTWIVLAPDRRSGCQAPPER